MPRGRKARVTEAEAEGSTPTVKELLEIMEQDRKRQEAQQKEQEEKRSKEHRELLHALAGLTTKRHEQRKRRVRDASEEIEGDEHSSTGESENESGGEEEDRRRVKGREPALSGSQVHIVGQMSSGC
uniref:Uncharacterized protein n=1 Tax=Amphimedon queenslandica TaxID=400682 RepID=A0A1X7TV33_AMPQE